MKFLKISILLLSILLCGCSTSPQNHNPTITLPANYAFLCSYNYENGIELYDSNGNVTFELENAQLDACIKHNGAAITPAAGLIPEKSYLFISQQKGGSTYSGVWDVETGEWCIPLQKGTGYVNANSGVFDWYTISNTNNIHYNIQLEPLKDVTLKSYKANEQYLHNEKSNNGLSYIADDTGNCILDGAAFYELNEHLGILEEHEQNSLELRHVYNNQYMYVYFKQYDSLLSDPVEYAFVCDTMGHILCADYYYTAAWNPTNQYITDEQNIFLLQDFITDTSYYVDAATGNEFILPAYGVWEFMTESYFIRDMGLDGICIYDSKTQTEGITFSDMYVSDIYILGLNTYVLEKPNKNTIVIDGTEMNIDSSIESVIVSDGPYTIISYGNAENPYDYCYIIDRDGHLVFETTEKVIYADAQYYITINDDNTFSINTFDENMTAKHPITTGIR